MQKKVKLPSLNLEKLRTLTPEQSGTVHGGTCPTTGNCVKSC